MKAQSIAGGAYVSPDVAATVFPAHARGKLLCSDQEQDAPLRTRHQGTVCLFYSMVLHRGISWFFIMELHRDISWFYIKVLHRGFA